MGAFVEAFKLAIEKPLHGLVLCVAGGGIWLGSFVFMTMQPAIAANSFHVHEAEQELDGLSHNIGQVHEHAVDQSVKLARIEGMLEMLIEQSE